MTFDLAWSAGAMPRGVPLTHTVKRSRIIEVKCGDEAAIKVTGYEIYTNEIYITPNQFCFVQSKFRFISVMGLYVRLFDWYTDRGGRMRLLP